MAGPADLGKGKDWVNEYLAASDILIVDANSSARVSLDRWRPPRDRRRPKPAARSGGETP